MLKKINAVISILLSAILVAHLLTMSHLFFTQSGNYNLYRIFAHCTMLLAAIHVTISIIIVFFCHSGTNISYYGKLNIRTIIQRITGLVIIAILHIHTSAFKFFMAGAKLSVAQKFGIISTESLFFISILLHLSVSSANPLITLGLLRSEKTERNMRRVVYILCAVLAIIACGSISMFIIKW